MRVLLSCLQSQRRHPVAAYQFWEAYFKRGIEEAGWEWSEVPDVDWAEPLALDENDVVGIAAWRERTWERVLAFVSREHAIRPFDIFLSYFYPRHVEPEAVSTLRQKGIACVNFFCDNVREFRRVPDAYRCFDLHWVPEFQAVSMYRAAGLPCLHAAMPVWVPPERRRWDHEENFGPTFIGGRDPQRERLFAEALQLGADVRLRGPGWQENRNSPSPSGLLDWKTRLRNQKKDIHRFGVVGLLWKLTYRMQAPLEDSLFRDHIDPAAFGDSYADVTQQARVTIGVNRYPSYYHSFNNPGTYSRLRDIEAPMLGACYLTEWAEGLDQMYDLGTEIETFRTAPELVEKVRQLAADPGRRRSMRRLAQQRALREHAVPHTLTRLAETIGVPA